MLQYADFLLYVGCDLVLLYFIIDNWMFSWREDNFLRCAIVVISLVLLIMFYNTYALFRMLPPFSELLP